MSSGNESTPLHETEISIPISGSGKDDIKRILWDKLSNFHDISWLGNSVSMLKATGGDAFSIGATRTFNPSPISTGGGTETVIEREDERMYLKWTLDTFKHYEAFFRIDDDRIFWKIQGEVPHEQLRQARCLLYKRLSTLVAESLITVDDKGVMDQHVGYLDRYTRLLLKIIPRDVLNADPETTTAAVITEPTLTKQKERNITKFKLIKYTLRTLQKDDYYGNLGIMDRFRFFMLSRRWLFPINDKYIDFPEHLVDKFRAYYPFDKCWNPPNQQVLEWDSDESIERMAFYGVMSMWIQDDKENEDNKNGFMCDYSQMAELTPREGFRRLGVKAYFNSAGELFKIRDCSENRDYISDNPGWNQAKTLLKVTVGQWNTAPDHLIGVHMMATNTVVNAAVQNLKIDHPIRRILQPFSFRSVYVNNRSMLSLLDPGSIVSHGVGYPYKEFLRLLEMGMEKCELWATPEERISYAGPNIQRISNESRFPYGNHATALYSCFKKFVENIVDHIYPSHDDVQNDQDLQNFAADLHDQVQMTKFPPPAQYKTKNDLIKVISTFMFNAAGMHEYAGTVSEYIDHPRKLGFRLREGSSTVDFQSWLTGMLLFTVTTVPMPKLMEQFVNCYTKDYERDEWNKCLADLQELSSKIQEDNLKNLKHPFRDFDPEYLECSVNV